MSSILVEGRYCTIVAEMDGRTNECVRCCCCCCLLVVAVVRFELFEKRAVLLCSPFLTDGTQVLACDVSDLSKNVSLFLSFYVLS